MCENLLKNSSWQLTSKAILSYAESCARKFFKPIIVTTKQSDCINAINYTNINTIVDVLS